MENPDSNNTNFPHKIDAGGPSRVGPDGVVHTLLSQIERHNRLSTDGLSKADETKIPGNNSTDHPTGQTFTQCLELGELILRSLDGNITSDDFAQLEKWIAEHPDALRYYLDYVHLCVDLQTSIWG